MTLSVKDSGTVLTESGVQMANPTIVKSAAGNWLLGSCDGTYDGGHYSGTGHIHRSSDEGATWVLKQTITARTYSSGTPGLFVMPNGDILAIVYEEKPAYGGINYIYRTTDDFETMTYQGEFPNSPDDELLVIDSLDGCVAGSKAYVCGFRYNSGITDMRAEVWSTSDNGHTWAKECNVTELGSGTFRGANEASIAYANGEFVITFRYDDQSGGAGYRSAIARGSLSALTITNVEGTLGDWARPGAEATHGGILAVFAGESEDRQTAWPSFAFSSDDSTWSTPVNVGNSTGGNLASSSVTKINGDVYVVRDKADGHGVAWFTITGFAASLTAVAHEGHVELTASVPVTGDVQRQRVG